MAEPPVDDARVALDGTTHGVTRWRNSHWERAGSSTQDFFATSLFIDGDDRAWVSANDSVFLLASGGQSFEQVPGLSGNTFYSTHARLGKVSDSLGLAFRNATCRRPGTCQP